MREMKDSGIEWIGEIPVDWRILPVKRFFRNEKRIVGSDVDKYERLALTMNGVIKRSKDDSEGLQPEKFEGYQILRENELVFKLIDLENVKTSRVGLSPYTGLVSPAYIVITNNKEDNRFYYYWFMFMYYNEVFNHLGGEGVRSALNAKDVLSLPVPAISAELMKRIADYLDTKCNKIDSIIEKQEKVIEKLKAYKLSVITEAVTKGLNPDVKMKDSGVEWIGEIPEHWKVSRIKYVTDFQPFCDTSHLSTDSIITYTPMENIKNGWYIPNTCEYGKLAKSLTQYCNGDIVMAKVTPCFENGNIAIMNNLSNGFGLGSSELFVFRSCNINTKYLFYWLRNNLFIKSACSTMTGTGGLKRISSYFTKNCYIHIPLANEQQQIADYLDKKCSAIDKSIEQKQAIIEKLKEYKKSLIYEVVTGKRKV